jgi:integrase
MAEKYSAHLTKRGLSPNRFNKHVRFLELMFRVLYDKARLTLNPWENIRRKRQAPQSRRELTIDELRRVCASAQGEMRLLLAVGIYTGLRLGDAATLRWGEVDLKRGIIRRIPNKTASRNPKPIHIPIHSSLAAILDELPQESRGDYVLPETAASYLRDPSIVTNSVRTIMEVNGISVHKPGTGFKTVTDSDGKEKQVHSGTRACVEVGFHSLRHTFVSMCREANAPLSVVESLVGHSNPTMTRLYSHTSELAAVSAVNLLPAVMGGDIPTPMPSPRMVAAAPIRALVEKLTGKNWKTTRDELLKIC